ncbi:MAG: PDZ domain-containing protein, partial [Phycisphaerales bacterium]|nr:PDZ domain-containing protein [Phycisphaerales bacterium]
ELRERPAQMPEAMKRDVMLGIRQMPVSGVLARHLGLEPGAGTLVAGVAKGMPAAAAGLKPYDVILTVNGEPVTSETGIAMIMQEKKTKIGELVKLGVIQQGTRKEIAISPIAFSAEDMEKAEWDEVESADMAVADGETRMFFGGPGEMGQLQIAPGGQELDGPGAMRFRAEELEKMMREFGVGRAGDQRAEILRREGLKLSEKADEVREADKEVRERLERLEKQLQQLIEQLNKKP